MNSLILELTGGIGNQLFSYAYARSLVTHFDLNLVLDGSVTERVIGREADLFEFALDGEPQLSQENYSPLELNMNRFLWRYPVTRKLSKRMQSSILSWDSEPSRYKDGGRIRGFFQGAEALDVIHDEKKLLFKLKDPSSNYKALRQEISEKQVISIHVRRGDYRNYRDNFGLLSPKYYESAIKEINQIDYPQDIWLFSDEPEPTLTELTKVGIRVDHVVSTTEVSVAETLKLMSLSKTLISANSTFSWWAGALGENMVVLTPQPWYRREDNWLKESALIPAAWKRHPADWVEYE